MDSHLISDSSRPKILQSAGVVLLILVGSIFYLYKSTLMAMMEIWERSETFTHCFLVLPISLWLVWRKKAELSKYLPAPNFWALILFVLFGLLWLLGDITATNSVSQFAVVGLLISSVILVFGIRFSKVIAFPLGFLFFAVPVGEFLLPTLMEWTANFTIYALRLTGIPVYRDGLQFVIPSGNWSVVEACSGVRYLIASLTVGALFAYLNYTSNKRRIIFIAVSIVVPIFANWLRAYMIVMLGHYSGNTIAVGVDHIIYGWVFFGIVVISMFMIGIRWAELSPVDPQTNTHPIIMPLRKRTSLIALGGVVGGLFICALPILVSHKINSSQNSQPVIISPPKILGNDWLLLNTPSDWRPSYKNFASEISSTYQKKGRSVGLYIGYYRNQIFDRKLISSENVIVHSEDRQWNAVDRKQLTIEVPKNSIAVKSTTLSHIGDVAGLRDQKMEVWYFYWINGELTDSDYLAKIYTGISKLLGRGDDAAVVVLHVVPETGIDSGEVLTQFLRDNYSQIDELLHTARAGNPGAVTTIGKS